MELLSIHEAAAFLGVAVGTLRNWRVEHRGPAAYKIGKFLRYERHELEAWVREQT